MKLRLGVMYAVLAVALLTGTAWGYPTRFGPATGLVDLPTADSALVGSAHFAADFARLESDEEVWPLRLVVGVSEGAEIGIGWARLRDTVDDDITSFGAKMTLMEEPLAEFSLAAGASFLDRTGADMLNLYVVATKEFPSGAPEAYRWQRERARMRGHVGAIFTRLTDDVDDDEIRPFVGFDVTTPEGTSFVAEYRWTDFGDDHAAAAVRYPLGGAMTIQVGVARAGAVLGQDDYRFIVGFNYDFTMPDKDDTIF